MNLETIAEEIEERALIAKDLPTWATDAGLDAHDLARHQQETADAFEPTLGAGEES